MDIQQARIPKTLPLQSATYSLNAQAHMLQEIFNAYVKARQGRFIFKNGACTEAFRKEHQTVVLSGGDARKNAAEAARPFFESAGISICFDNDANTGMNHYTSCAFFYLLYALYLGTLTGRIDNETCAKQLSWLSQVPSQAESIFKYTYDVKWFAKIKALRGTMLFTGDGVGEALADESARLMHEIAPSRAICIREASSLLFNSENSLLLAFILSKVDYEWAFPLLNIAKEKGLCAAAVTMHSLQTEVLRHTDACLPFPTAEAIAVPVLGIMPAQVFANDIALSKGLLAHSMLQ